MKSKFFIIILSCIAIVASAQQSYRDSLMALLLRTKEDTTRVNLLSRLSNDYNYASPDSQFLYAQRGLRLAQSIGYVKGEIRCKLNLTNYWWAIGDYATSIKLSYQIVSYAKEQNDTILMLYAYAYLFNSYRDQGDYKQALQTSFVSNELTQKYHSCTFCQISYALIGSVYYEMNQRDSALYYLSKALNYPKTMGPGWVLLMNGRIQAKMKNSSLAFDYYRQSVKNLQASNNLKDLAGAYISIAELYEKTGYADSAIYYGKQALNLAQQKKFLKEILQSYLFLSNAYEKSNTKISLDYYKLAMAAKDSLYSQEKQRQIVSYKFNEELKQQEEKNSQQQIRNRNRIYTLLGVLAGALLIVIILIRNNKHKQTINTILQQQKEKVERTLEKLNIANEQLENKNRNLEIEGALEKVRSRTMAMQKSDELAEAASLLFQQVRSLGIESYSSGFTVWENSDSELVSWMCNADGSINPPFRMPLAQIEWHRQQYDSWKKKEDYIIHDFTGEEMQDHFRYLRSFPLLDKAFKKSEAAGVATPLRQVHNAFNFSHGNLLFITLQPVPEAHEMFKRFAKVFEQTYIRFLDLQKAEAQTREAQIELGLERVRARAMAMQKSDELKELVATVFNELSKLDLTLTRCFIYIIDEKSASYRIWMLNVEDHTPDSFHIQFFDHAYVTAFLTAWKERKTNWGYHLKGDEKTAVCDHLFSQTELKRLPDIVKAGMREPYGFFLSWSFFNFGGLQVDSIEPLSEANLDILSRFGKVFDLTYTRFNDLKVAEAQAREARIEASLERVRSRAMAMQSSNELGALVGTVFSELTKLDLALTRSVIWIFDVNTDSATWWMANSEDPDHPINCYLPYHQQPPYLACLEQWKKRAVKFQYELSGKIKENWDDYLFSQTGLSQLPEAVISGMKAPDRVWLSASFNNFGALNVASLEPLSDEHFDILLRFAKVFDLTYTRFNDLKKAEAQAREAQIEAALEKVRSRSLAMHQTKELHEVVTVVSEKMRELNIALDGGILIVTFIEGTGEVYHWIHDPVMVSPAQYFRIPYYDHPIHTDLLEAKENKTDCLSKKYNYDEKNIYWNYTFEHSDYKKLPDDVKKFILESPGFGYSAAIGKYTAVITASFSGRFLGEAESKILKRFSNVFDQAYTRFLDLEKAEEQATEARIEASLERVRAKAMAMHNSKDLASTASMVFTELRKLCINPIRCGVGLLNKESRKAQLFSATSSPDGDSLALIGWVMLQGHPVLEKIYDTWLRNEDYYPELIGEQLKLYYQSLLAGLQVPLPDWQNGQKQYGNFFPFSVGCLYAWSENPYNNFEIKILKRFAAIIDLTFRRYIELQNSELTAKEVVKQAALDRIRADIASMRTTTDLERITPLIWSELTILGIPFIRCGIFIMHDEQQRIHTFLSTPDGKAIAAFHISYATPGNIAQVVSHWRNREVYTDYWDEKTFTEFANSLVEQSALTSSESYLSTLPAGGFYLHFLPFMQGMLYVGNTAPLEEEELEVIRSVAEAFSTAYARYEDFKKLEAAKQQVDNTLKELRSTQAQLIQSEKMASLGELTAGIAHEIQNPLNFVNNFSGVNKELIEEVKSQKSKLKSEELDELLDDIAANEEKILHHGKRADAIVKGMLQHSRVSTGKKEPTDINALADEYLRLAYHGLRAKDKDFNADFKTDFVDGIGKVEVVPQDIGRVLLNLYNNAFQAVAEKKKHQGDGYLPTVKVATKRLGNKIEIIVSDNGTGIPDKVIDKIFQPFFTTKPTGQGTGLGLSLSYDIIKAHGGEIKVESKEGEGCVFTIELPIVSIEKHGANC